MIIRIFEPILPDHASGYLMNEVCAECGSSFYPGERLSLKPIRPIEEGSLTWEAAPVHARCFLEGRRAWIEGRLVEITHVKDGDASPFPVVVRDVLTGESRQHKVEEIEEADWEEG